MIGCVCQAHQETIRKGVYRSMLLHLTSAALGRLQGCLTGGTLFLTPYRATAMPQTSASRA